MKYCSSFLLSFFLIITALFGQHTNVLISSDYDPNEPSIIINPKNTNQMVAGANLNNYYYSTNGGLSWITDTMHSSYGVWGDPAMLVDTSGSYYFFHLSNPDMGNWIDRIVCQKMDSLSKPWNDGSYFGLNNTKAQDKAWAALDVRNNTIYCTWTQFDDYGSHLTTDSSIILFCKSAEIGRAHV